jgi:hypothetical protein
LSVWPAAGDALQGQGEPGNDYDPDVIEELPIKYALGRIGSRRNAAKTRITKRP